MPKFKTQDFVFEDRGNPDSLIRFKADIQISQDGWFYTNLPEEIAELLIAGGVLPGQRVQTGGRFGKIIEKSYDGLIGKIKGLFDEYFSKELISDQLLIEYFISTSASYCKCADGELVPNGEWQRRKDGEYSGWINGSGYEGPGTGVSFYAHPIRRKVYAYKSGQQIIKDERISNSNRDDFGPELSWLASLPGNRPSYPLKYIEATEPVCRFFRELYISMWQINERIKGMIEPEQIQALAEGKFKLLS